MNKTVSNGKIGGSVMPSRLHDTFFNSSELTMTHPRTRTASWIWTSSSVQYWGIELGRCFNECAFRFLKGLSWIRFLDDPIFFPIPLPRFNTGSYYFAILWYSDLIVKQERKNGQIFYENLNYAITTIVLWPG